MKFDSIYTVQETIKKELETIKNEQKILRAKFSKAEEDDCYFKRRNSVYLAQRILVTFGAAAADLYINNSRYYRLHFDELRSLDDMRQRVIKIRAKATRDHLEEEFLRYFQKFEDVAGPAVMHGQLLNELLDDQDDSGLHPAIKLSEYEDMKQTINKHFSPAGYSIEETKNVKRLVQTILDLMVKTVESETK